MELALLGVLVAHVVDVDVVVDVEAAVDVQDVAIDKIMAADAKLM